MKTSNSGTLHNDAGTHVDVGGAEVEVVGGAEVEVVGGAEMEVVGGVTEVVDDAVILVRLHTGAVPPADLFNLDEALLEYFRPRFISNSAGSQMSSLSKWD